MRKKFLFVAGKGIVMIIFDILHNPNLFWKKNSSLFKESETLQKWPHNKTDIILMGFEFSFKISANISHNTIFLLKLMKILFKIPESATNGIFFSGQFFLEAHS